MTVDLFNAGLLPHKWTLLYVQHAIFYAHHSVVVQHAAVPLLRIVRHSA